MQFNIFQIIILFLIAYVCLYALVDRIMRCFEHCATARAYGEFQKAGMMVNRKDLEQVINNFAKGEFNNEERPD